MAIETIAVVAFDRISAYHLAVPCVVFGEALPADLALRLVVCAAEPGPLSTRSGFSVTVEHGLEVLAAAQTIIVPSWRDPQERPPQALLEGLVAAHGRGARLVGLCLGAFVLAETGLLDGRKATTHWAWAEEFARRYPGVHLDADVLYIDEGDILTSAGTAAGIDCCLHLLRRRYGADSANRVARMLVVPPHRQGGQAQFIDQPLPATARDDRLAGLLDWVRANLAEAHSLDSLAAKAMVSRRTFTRRFRQLTGATVGEWLLETTNQPVDRIADLAGFGSPVSLRQHFRRAFGVSPMIWRRSFRGD